MNSEVRTLNCVESILKTKFHLEIKIDLINKLLDNYRIVKKGEEERKINYSLTGENQISPRVF